MPLPRQMRIPRVRWFVLATVLLAVFGLGTRWWMSRLAIRGFARFDGRAFGDTSLPTWLPLRFERLLLTDDRVASVMFVCESGDPHSWHKSFAPEHGRAVARFSSLNGVYIHGARIESDALTPFADKASITNLSLTYCEFAAGASKPLTQMVGLETVNFEGSTIGDADLGHLCGCSSLKSLSLFLTRIDDRGLEQLRCLPRLAKLTLSSPQITDAGLEHVGGLTSLVELRLLSMEITDAGLMHLTALSGLEKLYLFDTKVTPAGIEQLREAHPSLSVFRDSSQSADAVPKPVTP